MSHCGSSVPGCRASWLESRLQAVLAFRLEPGLQRIAMARPNNNITVVLTKPHVRARLAKDVPIIRETVIKHRAILYFQDESNVSLTAFLGKTWAPCGKTPRSRVTGKRGSIAALSALSRRGHLLFGCCIAELFKEPCLTLFSERAIFGQLGANARESGFTEPPG